MTEQPNLNFIKELSGGDVVFEQKILDIIKIELPEEINTYKIFIEKNNFNEASELVHKLKHKISILGLKNSYQLAVEYEEDLKNENKNLQEKFESILNLMINYIKSF